MIYRISIISRAASIILAGLIFSSFGYSVKSQTAFVVDPFDPAGTAGNSYTGGQIGSVWGNWFGSAFSNLVWDATSDASNNPASGSLRININFNGQGSIPNQFLVYDANGFFPSLNGMQYTNFQCDVRFAGGSAVITNGGVVSFGHLQFGVSSGSGQDYFGDMDVPAGNTNWVHVNLPINAASDVNLQTINNVLIHIYGPFYGSPGLSGVSTLWVDNIQFTGPSPVITNCVVNWNEVHQRIDGFGASSAWNGSWSAAQADIFFSTNNGISYTDNLGIKSINNGIGLSLLRNRIAPATSPSAAALPTTVETSIMTMAQARGAAVWSTPWTPAAGFKNNHATSGGGYLGSGNNSTNLAYASQLANYVISMKSQGINLYAISVQNEPDAQVTTYDSCNWSAKQIHDFTTNLYNALVAGNVASTKIMLPESENWSDPSNLVGTAMGDPSVAADVGVIAGHNYDGANGPATLTKNNFGKSLWETEVSLLSGSDSSINNGVYYAERVYLFMTVAQVNAWHYWWLISGAGGNQGLMDNNSAITKRLFTVGNYSRFVRPGYYRVGVSNNAYTFVSAYKDPVSGNFAIVAINPIFSPTTQIFNLTNFTAGSVTPWITSGNLSLASQPAISVVNAAFTYALPAMSVTTFIGQMVLPNTPPTIAPIASQTINAGMTLVLTNVAIDADLPPQTLTFSLLDAPTNAVLTMVNGTNGIFTWRPLVSQAGTTNLVSVQVTDNGTPNLSATNNFNVVVNPAVQPVLSSIVISSGQVNLLVNGPAGPDYTLLTSTNLIDWQALFTTNSPILPLILSDPVNDNSERFYRIQIGP